MNTEQTLKTILAKLENIEKILSGRLAVDQSLKSIEMPVKSKKLKTITLPELARRNSSLNGQQKITLIVGYCEKLTGMSSITIGNIKDGWRDGKFAGSFASMLIHRAVKEGLIRDLKGEYDLSQTGEDLFNDFMSNKGSSELTGREGKA